MPVEPAVLSAVTAELALGLPGIEPDEWAPSVQGAVGHVVGMRDASGGRYVLKIYPDATPGRAGTEEFALRRLAGEPEVPVPRAVLSGTEPSTGRDYLLMSRLAGVRWADRRRALTAEQAQVLTADVGRTLRELHRVTGPSFGSLVGDGPRWATAEEMVLSLSDAVLAEYRTGGGPPEVVAVLGDHVGDHRAALRAAGRPALCHNDFIDSNLIVADTGAPHLSGVVDFERASWNEPMSDLAQTRVHVRFHDPAAVSVLTAGYGELTAAEHQRLGLYELLHQVRERNWIAVDRPPGWVQSIEKLDAELAGRA